MVKFKYQLGDHFRKSEEFHQNSQTMLLQVKHHVHEDEEDYSISGELNED